MNQQKFPIYLSKSGGMQNTAIDRFREHLYYLQVRINDFIYFHSNEEDNEHSDLTQKSHELYNIADKAISSILEFIKVDETSTIISKNDAINYIKGMYKQIKDKGSIYYTLKKSLKELCQSRDPDEFQEFFVSSDACLEKLGIQLNNDELKLFKNKLKKIFQNETKLEDFVDDIQDLELSEEKEILLGQVLSEYCLYISLKLLKQSKSNFKESCKKIDDAYRVEIENTILNLTNEITSLRTENEQMKQLNEKNTLKLKENEIQIDELQELLDMRSIQNKKLSDEIMELKGNASSPDIIYNLDDSSDAEIDTSEILSYLSESEPSENNPNANFLSKTRNIVPPSFDEDEFEINELKPKKLTIPFVKSYSKKEIVAEKANKPSTNSKKDKKEENNEEDNKGNNKENNEVENKEGNKENNEENNEEDSKEEIKEKNNEEDNKENNEEDSKEENKEENNEEDNEVENKEENNEEDNKEEEDSKEDIKEKNNEEDNKEENKEENNEEDNKEEENSKENNGVDSKEENKEENNEEDNEVENKEENNEEDNEVENKEENNEEDNKEEENSKENNGVDSKEENKENNEEGNKENNEEDNELDSKEDKPIDNSNLLVQLQEKDAIIQKKDDEINEKEDIIQQLKITNQLLLDQFKKICIL